jgi:multidrug resistance efflux pump
MTEPFDKRMTPEASDGRPAAGIPSTLTDRVRALRLGPQISAARPRSSRLPWILCVVLLLLTLGFGYRAFTAGTSAGKSDATSSAAVGGSEAVADSGDVVLESKGYIIPVHQIQVSPKVGGMVMDLYFQEGDQVKDGQVLAQLETDDYQADRDHAKKQVEVAEAQIDAAKAGTTQAEAGYRRAVADLDQMKAKVVQYEKDWDRAQRLAPTKVLADVDVDTIRAQYETARSALAVGEAAIAQADAARAQAKKNEVQAERSKEQAQADLNKAEWRLKQCTIKAPVSGTILTKKAEKGNIVNPVAFNISASLCDMADLSDLEVDLTIQERDVGQVHKWQKCRIRSEAFPNERLYEGYVSRLMPTADRAKGAVPVRVKIKVDKREEGRELKPDMSVIVSFTRENLSDEEKKDTAKPEQPVAAKSEGNK